MTTTLRLNFPQWQGGNEDAYHLGGRLLSFLAPAHDGPAETVGVPLPDGTSPPLNQGILSRLQLLAQAQEARALIDRHRPDRIVTLGGDCLVGLAPVAYLSQRYPEGLGVLWVDAHPDVMNATDFSHAHAHVLGILLHRDGADPDFAAEVVRPLPGHRVMYAGMNACSASEAGVIEAFGMTRVSSAQLRTGTGRIADWIRDNGIRQLAVHLDLDVLDPARFGPVLFNKPDAGDAFAGIPQGDMTRDEVVGMLTAVAGLAEIVGLTVTEHLPWEAIRTAQMLSRLPLLGR